MASSSASDASKVAGWSPAVFQGCVGCLTCVRQGLYVDSEVRQPRLGRSLALPRWFAVAIRCYVTLGKCGCGGSSAPSAGNSLRASSGTSSGQTPPVAGRSRCVAAVPVGGLTSSHDTIVGHPCDQVEQLPFVGANHGSHPRMKTGHETRRHALSTVSTSTRAHGTVAIANYLRLSTRLTSSPRARRVRNGFAGRTCTASRIISPPACVVTLYPRASTASGLSDSRRPVVAASRSLVAASRRRIARGRVRRRARPAAATGHTASDLRLAEDAASAPADRAAAGRRSPASEDSRPAAAACCAQASGQFVGRGNHALGRFAGRQGAHVGHEVGQRHVDLVPHGRDDRQLRGERSPAPRLPR